MYNNSLKKVAKNIFLKKYNAYSFIKYGKQKYIFLHSHMRARSTLMSSILSNSIEISGDQEYHLTYNSPSDLDQLRWIIIRMNRKWKPLPRFLLDNINHSVDKVDPSLFTESNIFHIFLLREPQATRQSCLARWGQNRTLNYFINYYTKRVNHLASLGELASRSPNGAIYVESDQLIDKTEETLSRLTKYLQLREPLSGEYKRETPSLNHAQNQSDFLSQGKIVKQKRKYEQEIAEDLLSPCKLAYESTHQSLMALLGY
jgi:hypothetical protein